MWFFDLLIGTTMVKHTWNKVKQIDHCQKNGPSEIIKSFNHKRPLYMKVENIQTITTIKTTENFTIKTTHILTFKISQKLKGEILQQDVISENNKETSKNFT